MRLAVVTFNPSYKLIPFNINGNENKRDKAAIKLGVTGDTSLM